MASPDPSHPRLAPRKFRAWHRGTREADYIVGGFFDAQHAAWDEAALGWFEVLLEEQDVDIIAWALGTAAPPAALEGPHMQALRALDYVRIAR